MARSGDRSAVMYVYDLPYADSDNDPINKVDPLGLRPVGPRDAAGAGKHVSGDPSVAKCGGRSFTRDDVIRQTVVRSRTAAIMEAARRQATDGAAALQLWTPGGSEVHCVDTAFDSCSWDWGSVDLQWMDRPFEFAADGSPACGNESRLCAGAGEMLDHFTGPSSRQPMYLGTPATGPLAHGYMPMLVFGGAGYGLPCIDWTPVHYQAPASNIAELMHLLWASPRFVEGC